MRRLWGCQQNMTQGTSNYTSQSIPQQPLLLHQLRCSLILKAANEVLKLGGFSTVHHTSFSEKFPVKTNHQVQSRGCQRFWILEMELFSHQRCFFLHRGNETYWLGTRVGWSYCSSQVSGDSILWRIPPFRLRDDSLWRSEAEACFWLSLYSGLSSQGWDAAAGYRMRLCRGLSAQEAELNSICASLSPLNYSSRDRAPETTALGDKGCCQHNCTACILSLMRARRMHFWCLQGKVPFWVFQEQASQKIDGRQATL